MEVIDDEMLLENPFQRHLEEEILSFWVNHMVDEEHGGFYGRMDDNMVLDRCADKAVILNVRILWTFSAAYSLNKMLIYRELADRAYRYLVEYFIDQEHGGVFWTLNTQGAVTQTKKYIYAQAFAIYALSEYHKINPESNALSHAKDLYALIEAHSYDCVKGGYLEAMSREWKSIDDVRLSDKDLNATKTMNTHLHVLEAYTNLYRIWPIDLLRDRLKNLVTLLSDRFLDEKKHFHLFFDSDWTLLSHTFSYGHDIEGSWLLYEAAKVIDDDSLLAKTIPLSVQMVEAALEGLDEDGGVMCEGDASGLIDTDKHWWPQAEALVGLMNAWELTQKPHYLNMMQLVWSFIQKTLKHEMGEWYWRVDRSGAVINGEDLAGPWKCPYHNGRAMIELDYRLKKAILAGKLPKNRNEVD